MNDEETNRRFEEIEKRLKELEDRKEIVTIKKSSLKKNSLKGIPKGIMELIDNGFFDIPKSVTEAVKELNKEGYFGNKQTIDVCIRRDFFTRKKILTRIKEGKIWKYVFRK